MSLDSSLKSKASLARHRNVLSRSERLAKLAEAERWDEKKSVFGLPKVANRKMNVGKKAKKEEAAEGDAAAAPAAGAAPAKGAAPAAAKPAAGGKPAAPAAKAPAKK